MKGIAKFAKRTPHMLGGKVGMATKSHDAQFDDMNRRFTVIEKYTEKLLKDSTTFREAVKNMLMAGETFGACFAGLFSPIGAEIDIGRIHPQALTTIDNLPIYRQHMEDLRETLTPEIELIDSRIISPVNDFTGVLKAVRKNITKRDHKLVDFDRHNNTYTKARDKKEKTLKDEQNLFKIEQEFETAAADYEYYNNTMKEELPRFFEMASRFITPLFHSFYYMQLNVFYLTLDKLQTFADGRYDVSAQASATIEDNYVAHLSDAAEKLEALSIRKPAMPTAKLLQQNRSPSVSSGSNGAKGAGLASRAPSKASLNRTPSSTATSPPPYTSGSGASSTAVAASGKRAPPPPPTKPKPGATSSRSYVVALYDYVATADGDLSFNAGDRIEVVERTASTEDWWTGIVNDTQGVFPGNYVRDE